MNRNCGVEKHNKWTEKLTRGPQLADVNWQRKSKQHQKRKAVNRLIEIMQSEQEKEKKGREMNRASKICGAVTWTNIQIMKAQGDERNKRVEKVFEEMIGKYFQIIIKLLICTLNKIKSS